MDEIFLEDIEVFAHHGVYDFEKKNGQRFFVSVRFFIKSLTENDNLSDTINYGEVALKIESFMKETQYNLLESLASGIAAKLLYDYELAQEVEVTVKKPDAPINVKFGNVMVVKRMGWHTAYLGIGSNIGDRKSYLDGAVKGFEGNEKCKVQRISSYIETKPYGVADQGDFLNAALMIKTLLSPQQLLNLCHELEKKAGRVKTRRWGERTLDVDILAYDSLILDEKDLKIPHIEMHMRDFVLIPMNEIAAGFVHPVLQKTIYMLLKENQNRIS